MTTAEGAVVVVGGTSGLGLELARYYAGAGREVVISGRDPARTAEIAEKVGARPVAFDLARPHEIARSLDEGLADVGRVQYLVLAAIDRDANNVADYKIDQALYLATMKLVGNVEVVHALLPRIDRENGALLLFGGQAKDVPYPGSTTVTAVNGAVATMVNTLALELRPLRVNALHPAIVVDSPYWAGNDAAVARMIATTPTHRPVMMEDVVGACRFLLENRGANAVNLTLDAGRRLASGMS